MSINMIPAQRAYSASSRVSAMTVCAVSIIALCVVFGGLLVLQRGQVNDARTAARVARAESQRVSGDLAATQRDLDDAREQVTQLTGQVSTARTQADKLKSDLSATQANRLQLMECLSGWLAAFKARNHNDYSGALATIGAYKATCDGALDFRSGDDV